MYVEKKLLQNVQKFCYQVRVVTKWAVILLRNARLVTERAVVTGGLAFSSYRMQPWIYMHIYITLNHNKLAA